MDGSTRPGPYHVSLRTLCERSSPWHGTEPIHVQILVANILSRLRGLLVGEHAPISVCNLWKQFGA